MLPKWWTGHKISITSWGCERPWYQLWINILTKMQNNAILTDGIILEHSLLVKEAKNFVFSIIKHFLLERRLQIFSLIVKICWFYSRIDFFIIEVISAMRIVHWWCIRCVNNNMTLFDRRIWARFETFPYLIFEWCPTIIYIGYNGWLSGTDQKVWPKTYGP